MDYLTHILVLCAVYAILAVALDLLAGQAGILSLAQGAFFGVGAYVSALLSLRLELPFLLTFLAAAFSGMCCSLFVSLPSLRLRDDYFVIATFGFQLVVISVLNNWLDLTGGPTGVRGIPRPTILGFELKSALSLLALAGVVLMMSWMAVLRLAHSPFGRALRAIAEDEVFATALGKNSFSFKVVAVAVSAMLSAGAGSIYAHYATYIDPTGFGVMESILIVSMVIIGGAGSTNGPVLGAVVLVVFPEVLRLVGIPGHVAANLRQIAYGLALIVVMWLRPTGLVARRLRPNGTS